MPLESMRGFFAARVDLYDAHMLEEVEGCREGYREMAAALPEGLATLLDLGCGTGLELGDIFRRFPSLAVTGVDLSEEMLARLREKFAGERFAGRDLTLVCGDYFACPFGGPFDAAVSFQSLHHFPPDAKRRLYQKIRDALRPGGCYLEGDYMADTAEQEAFFQRENERLRREQGVPDGEYWPRPYNGVN